MWLVLEYGAASEWSSARWSEEVWLPNQRWCLGRLMADFEAPSFSLGLDCDDSDRQFAFAIQNTDSYPSNHLSIAAATLEDVDFETLIVDDSEPEYPDPHPKRRRRLLTVPANTKAELHSVSDREDVDTFSSQDGQICSSSKLPPDTQNIKQIDSDTDGSKSYSNRRQFDLLQHVGLSKEQKVVESMDVSTTENPLEDYRSMKHETHVVQANRSSHVTRISLHLDDSFPPAHRYFFHDDSRIQELVRNRLPNFSPLSNRDRDQHPCRATIDYKGQFRHGESSDRKIKDKKSSSSRKTSKGSKIEEESQGWVNPKLSVDKGLTKGTTKRISYAVQQTAGHWFTDLDGKKVYVSKKGEELSGQIAYRQYRKESGAGFKRAKKRKSTKN